MPQTVYQRPWPQWVVLTTTLPLTVAWVALTFTKGAADRDALTAGSTSILMIVLFFIFDPETTITTRGVLPDGTAVKIRRPLIGFKKYESQLGVTGGYEVRIDGFRYERAYIRI